MSTTPSSQFRVRVSASRYRPLLLDAAFNPFQGPPETDYGGAKHVFLQWHPPSGRVYTFGGDYGRGAGAFGQGDMGSTITTNDPAGGRSYERSAGLCNDIYSIDPMAADPVPWRLEHPYLPRNLGGTRESRPPRGCQVSMAWDPVRARFWTFSTFLRTEFYYLLADGTPDRWANGESTISGPIEPVGTWSFLPNAAGGAGTFTLETANRLAYRMGEITRYEGGVLVTGIGDERLANWSYDPTNDVIVCLGGSWGSTGALFTFKPGDKTFEYRLLGTSAYEYINSSSTYVGITGGWAHGVGLAKRTNGTRSSVLVRVNIAAALALPNGSTLDSGAGAWEAVDLPFSLSPGGVFESSNDASEKWQEHAGVCAIDDKVAIICSYRRFIDGGVTKLSVWDTSSLTFKPGEDAPEDIRANAWVSLPDTGEVLFGHNNNAGYTTAKMWAYRVR